jgi:hypothetical protein
MGEYRITVALTGLGAPEVAEANSERLLTAFEETAPSGAGPAVGADLAEGLLEVTYSVEAGGYEEAFAAGNPIFAAGMSNADLGGVKIARIEVEEVAAVDEREPIPA